MNPHKTQSSQPITEEVPQPHGTSKLRESEPPLCRLMNGLVLKRPSSRLNLKKTISNAGSTCTCQLHNPLAYAPEQCSTKHSLFEEAKPDQPWTPPKDLTPVGGYGGYEALHLAHYTALYINTPEESMSPKQKIALRMLGANLHECLNAVDVSNVPTHRMLCLLDLISDLFFFGSLKDLLSFEWFQTSNELKEGQYRTTGSCKQIDTGYLISLDPIDHDADQSSAPRGREYERIKTLVHEFTHAFLNFYCCCKCPSWEENVNNVGGHGRAFMEISTAIERAFDNFGRPNQSIAGTHTWLAQWTKVKYLPSRHDMQNWGWIKSSRPSDQLSRRLSASQEHLK